MDPALAILPQDSPYRDLLAFHVKAFETVFARAYDGNDSGYLFDQPLDESAFAATIAGHNTAGDPCSTTILLAQPVDISSVPDDPSGQIHLASASVVGGTLDAQGSISYYGIAFSYDLADGQRHNDLLLLTEMDQETTDTLMHAVGLLPFASGGSATMEQCVALCEISFDVCIDNAGTTLAECVALAVVALAGCLARCILFLPTPAIGELAPALCALRCSVVVGPLAVAACLIKHAADVARCRRTLDGCLAACGVVFR